MIILSGIARRWTAWKWPHGVGHGYGGSYKRVRNAVVPRPVRYWGGWGAWLAGHAGPRALLSLHWRVRYRTVNRIKDITAVAAGWCNFSPWREGLHQGRIGPAYSHWRCLRRSGHQGPHRFINYTSDDQGVTTYDPVPVTRVDMPWPEPRPGPWLRNRHACARLREARMQERILARIRKVKL